MGEGAWEGFVHSSAPRWATARQWGSEEETKELVTAEVGVT